MLRCLPILRYCWLVEQFSQLAHVWPHSSQIWFRGLSGTHVFLMAFFHANQDSFLLGGSKAGTLVDVGNTLLIARLYLTGGYVTCRDTVGLYGSVAYISSLLYARKTMAQGKLNKIKIGGALWIHQLKARGQGLCRIDVPAFVVVMLFAQRCGFRHAGYKEFNLLGRQRLSVGVMRQP